MHQSGCFKGLVGYNGRLYVPWLSHINKIYLGFSEVFGERLPVKVHAYMTSFSAP